MSENRIQCDLSTVDARQLLSTAENGKFAEAVKVVLKSRCPVGRLTIYQVAELADMSVRSLQRKLASCDVVFSELVNNARAELAVERLKDFDLSLDEIAGELGYSTSSNFARAFRRWTGETPADFRRNYDQTQSQ